jgi:AcrR family transcriptional regulator
MTAEPLTDRGRRTRDSLIGAARGVFEERGYDATRMSDIAQAAGVSHGTVYTWFATKDAVLGAVVDSIVSDLYHSLRTPEGTDAITRIDLANRAYLDAYRANARLLSVVEQAATSREEFQAVLAGLRATHVRRVGATIERLQVEGEARRDLDANVAAAALCSMVEGFARHWFGRGESYDEDIAVSTLTALWASSLQMTPALHDPPRERS